MKNKYKGTQYEFPFSLGHLAEKTYDVIMKYLESKSDPVGDNVEKAFHDRESFEKICPEAFEDDEGADHDNIVMYIHSPLGTDLSKACSFDSYAYKEIEELDKLLEPLKVYCEQYGRTTIRIAKVWEITKDDFKN